MMPNHLASAVDKTYQVCTVMTTEDEKPELKQHNFKINFTLILTPFSPDLINNSKKMI